MSVHVSSWVWKHSKAKGTQLLVLLSLADMANDDGACWPSIKSICARCRVSERAVQENLRSAERMGELEILKQQARYGTNIFQFTAFRGAPNAPLKKEGCAPAYPRGEPGRVLGVNGSAPEPTRETPKETTTTPEVVVALSAFATEDERDFRDALRDKFDLSESQSRMMDDQPIDFLRNQIAIILSEPRKNLAGCLVDAVKRGGWKAKRSYKPAPKPKPRVEASAAPELTPEEKAGGLARFAEMKRTIKNER